MTKKGDLPLQRFNGSLGLAQDFAGARCCSAVNSLMIKGVLLVGLGLLGFCFCLTAQQTSRMERSKDETSSLRQLRYPRALSTPAELNLSKPEFSNTTHGSLLTDDLLMLTLWDGPHVPGPSELGWIVMPPFDFEDDLLTAAKGQEAEAARADGKDLPSKMVNSPLSPIYYSGELGVFYGHSSGKFDGEIMQTYFLGEVGNEQFHITVGTAYEQSNVDVPRLHSGWSKH
jgi:hypothetical protein